MAKSFPDVARHTYPKQRQAQCDRAFNLTEYGYRLRGKLPLGVREASPEVGEPPQARAKAEAAELLAIRHPALFQLRPPFVLEERIGIAEIDAKQILTFRLHTNERSRQRSRTHIASWDFDRGDTCGTDGLPLRKRGCRSYQNTFAISANISRNQHASMSRLLRLIS
ncbi:hypothetical protein ABIB80_004134 [Bradyrhizobium sp. i1.15.2]|uniref:hypothetical protein n=1 Tax=Bradyrhizobium sp. i1.15.2 TaxID=3156362 RepID=UPI003395B5E4